MHLRILDAAETRALLPMAACVDVMARAMAAVSDGAVIIPPRIISRLAQGDGLLAAMPGAMASPNVYGAKIVSLVPSNPSAGRPAVQGVVLLFDPATGAPSALVDGAAITTLRTAAVSGLATRLLARADAATVGVLGCGAQAEAHIEAMLAVRRIDEVRVWGRSHDKARLLVDRVQATTRVRLTAVLDARDASDCDIVCAVSGATDPILLSAHVREGAHINLVGAHAPGHREADTDLIVRARVFADSLAAMRVEAGDILIPIAEGAITESHVAGEIGALVSGRISGRQGPDDVTLFKSLGLVAQDLAAAEAVRVAAETGA